MAIVCGNTNLLGCQSEHPQEKRLLIRGTKKMETLVLVGSILSTRETFGAHSHVVIAHLSHFNCERHHWLFLSQAGISTERSYSYMLLYHVLTQKKADVLKVLSVTQVVNHGKMFDDCGCASKWKWVSINCSQRHEKPVQGSQGPYRCLQVLTNWIS